MAEPLVEGSTPAKSRQRSSKVSIRLNRTNTPTINASTRRALSIRAVLLIHPPQQTVCLWRKGTWQRAEHSESLLQGLTTRALIDAGPRCSASSRVRTFGRHL